MDKNIFEQFLEGRDDQKHIVSVESSYDNNYVHLIIHDPVDGKRIEKHRFRPFLWMKEIDYRRFYKGNRNEIRKKMVQYNISFKELKHTDNDGDVVDRLKNGYRYIVHTSQSYSKLLDFFKYGGLSPNDNRDLFLTIGTTEQFLIQTGKRLFKGMEDYDEVHRLTFDIETTGLYPENSYIFEIGVKDNRGFEEVIKIKDETEEIKGIKRFFDIIDELKPAIICGYNSENFDWDFIFKRTKIHEERIESIASTLKYDSEIKRKKATLKMGAEMEYYEQTVMWGYNIMDIWHAVRRAAAINSNIKETGLKYITKFEKMAKPNRIYIAHQNISELWNSKEEYILNNENGKYEKYNGTQLTENENIVTGEYIVTRYLLDDLWETEQIDYIYNQATFLLSKIVPSTLQRTSTMGTAALWKTLMLGWSYENDLAIPSYQPKQKFTGGLSRLLKVGYSKNVVKFDYGSLYPSIQLTHNVFPDVDVSEALKGFLKYIFDSRAFYKKKMKEAKKKGDDKKAKLFDRKQLPLKILNNSNFGSVSAPDVYPWGDINVGEMITCTGRQYLRLMITFFMGKGYEPIVGDSVTYDTPIYLLNDQTKEIDIIPICDLFNESSEFLDKEKLRDYEKKNYSVLTVNGWKNINYVYRHETDKTIHRVSTKDRLVCVTEDHSLFRDGKMIKPSELNRGEKIDVYELPIYDNINDIENEDLYWLYGFFLGDGSAIYGSRKQYYKSKKTGNININKGIRGEWKISNKDINLLNKLKDIIIKNYPELNPDIKNHMNSSGVYNLVIYNTNFSKKFAEDFYTSYREKKIPSFILNTSIKNKTAFINGVCASDGYGTNIEDTSDIGMKSQIAMAGIGYLLKGLGIEYKIKLRKDKQNFINFSIKNRNRNNSNFTDKTKRKTDEVWNNEIINNKNKFVYDISTEDGTFIGGIGAINLKNTDGFNFIIPDDIDSHVYITKGIHKNYKKGETISGVAGDIAEFNETYMRGVMELNIDEFCESSINIARKNYANLIDGEVKIVGNTLKSNKLPVYIEEFLDVGIRHLLNGNGKEFLNLYYDYIDKIFSKEISLIKIASKSKVKQTIEEYKKRCNEKNINGNPLPKQAHMELLIKENVKVNLGDIVYYVNTGTKKSHGDVQTKKNKETGDNELIFNCILITKDTIDSIDAKTINYNISKYIDAFNKRIEPLLVCFSPDIRDSILISNPEDRPYFTDKQMELVAGEPMDPEDQDNLEEDVMKMEDSELSFWERNDIDPNYMIKKKVSV